MYGKVPPQARDFEEAVLGAIMLEKGKIDFVMQLLPLPEMFYVNAHQLIYEAIITLVNSGDVVDLLTVTAQLDKEGNLETVGGAYYITKLTMSVVSSAHVEYHAHYILERYMDREVIRIGSEMVHDGYELSVEPKSKIEHAQNLLFNLSTNGVKKDYRHVSKSVVSVQQKIQQQIHAGVEFTGVPTPFKNLTLCTGGWQKKDFIVLAARPSVGKTAVSLCIAMAAAFAEGKPYPVGFFSMEMPEDQLTRRMISNISRVDLKRISNAKHLSQEELLRIDHAAQALSKVPIFIDDTAGLTLTELRAKARRQKEKNGIELIIVDYLQLLTGDSNKSEMREREISKISRELKKMAMDLDIPVIALSQLSRAVDSREDKEPKLSDLRESGSIEQDADIVMFLYKPDKKMLEKKPHLAGMAMLSIAKHRNGELDEFVYKCNNHIQKWEEITSNPFDGFTTGSKFSADPQTNYEYPGTDNDEEDLPF